MAVFLRFVLVFLFIKINFNYAQKTIDPTELLQWKNFVKENFFYRTFNDLEFPTLRTIETYRLNIAGLSAGCQYDVNFWLDNIEQFINATIMNCTKNDEKCSNEKKEKLEQSVFAIEQLDAFGKIPAGMLEFRDFWMGDWEQCLNLETLLSAGYKAQFCWAKLIAPAIVVGAASGGGDLNVLAQTDWCAINDTFFVSTSVCMPKSCNAEDITILLNAPFRYYSNETKIFCKAKCRDAEPAKTTGYWIMISVLLTVGLVMFTATVIDYAIKMMAPAIGKELKSNSALQPFLTFSVYTNGGEILNQAQRPGQITAVHCIRFVSMTWVMASHVVVVSNYVGFDNPLALATVQNKLVNHIFLNGYFAVDSFFYLSGLLLAYLFYKEMDKAPAKIKSPKTWFMFYLHRYIRLTPPYMIFLAFATIMFDYFTIGPRDFGPNFRPELCHTRWWTNLLYINNFVDIDKQCFGIAWYLAADMQMHIFAPLLLVPLFYSKIAGIISGFLILAISTAANYATFLKYHLYIAGIGQTEDPDMVENSDILYWRYLYGAAWIRCTPYIIGVFTGYFLHKMRGKTIRINWFLAFIGWCLAMAIGLACVLGLWRYSHGDMWSPMLRATYYNFSRIGWAVGLSWVVFACEHGYAGPIKDFLSLGFWQPLGRLSYCAYLVHFFVVYSFLAMERQTVHFSDIYEKYVHGAIPVVVLSYMVAFIWSCAFELPSGKLEKLILDSIFGKSEKFSEKSSENYAKTNGDGIRNSAEPLKRRLENSEWT